MSAAAQNPQPLFSWDQWRQAIVSLLRVEFADALPHIGLDDVDWPAWRCFYDAGRTPRSAINRALERDL